MSNGGGSGWMNPMPGSFPGSEDECPAGPRSAVRRIVVVEPATVEAGIESVRRSPSDAGTVELIVRRPSEEARELVAEAELDVVEGLLGDNWRARGTKHTGDGSADPECQLTLANARAI